MIATYRFFISFLYQNQLYQSFVDHNYFSSALKDSKTFNVLIKCFTSKFTLYLNMKKINKQVIKNVFVN